MPQHIVCESCHRSRPIPEGPEDWPVCECGWDEYRVEWQDVPNDPAHDPQDRPNLGLGDEWRYRKD